MVKADKTPEGPSSLARLMKSKGAVVTCGFIISIFLLVMTARKIAWHEAGEAFSHATWLPWLPLAVAVYLLGMLLRGLRLKQLVSMEAKITVLTASNIVCVGYATNNILPARLGEFARAGMLAERTGLPYALSLTVTFLERLLDGLIILCIFVVASLIIPTQEWMHHAAQLAGVIFAVAVAFILLLAFAPQLSLMLVSQLTSPLGRQWHDRAIALITQITRGLSCLHDLNTTLAVLLSSLSVWILEGIMYALIMPCFAIPFSPVKAQAIMALTNLGILVPSSPGYVGLYHFICAKALQAVTGQNGLPQFLAMGFLMPNLSFLNQHFLQEASKVVSETTALSYAVVVHLVFYVTVTLWGVIAMARYGLELGTTAALAWQAKPMQPLSETDRDQGVSVITSVAASNEQGRRYIQKTPFWTALVEAILPLQSLDLTAESSARCVDFAADFTCDELSHLPQGLKPLVKIGISGFRVLTLLTSLSFFEALPVAKRRAIVNAWSYGRIPLTRKFFKPIRSVTLLAFYECPEVQAALNSGQAAAGTNEENLLPVSERDNSMTEAIE
ncbi:MAG: flippase-like domain-containing protein [Cyanobacteria bacterium SZAS LIN-3]|nr:flippase-like domain-containing protein [Cyanobacteria bacterium SZAS LIN-3]